MVMLHLSTCTSIKLVTHCKTGPMWSYGCCQACLWLFEDVHNTAKVMTVSAQTMRVL